MIGEGAALSIWVRILRWIFKVQRLAYQHRRYSLSLVAIFIVVIGSAALDVKNSNDPMLFFSDNNIHRQKLEDYREVFGKSAATLIALDADEAGAPLHLLEAERYSIRNSSRPRTPALYRLPDGTWLHHRHAACHRIPYRIHAAGRRTVSSQRPPGPKRIFLQ